MLCVIFSQISLFLISGSSFYYLNRCAVLCCDFFILCYNLKYKIVCKLGSGFFRHFVVASIMDNIYFFKTSLVLFFTSLKFSFGKLLTFIAPTKFLEICSALWVAKFKRLYRWRMLDVGHIIPQCRMC